MTRQAAGHARPQRDGITISTTSRLMALVIFLTAAFSLLHRLGDAGSAGDGFVRATPGAALLPEATLLAPPALSSSLSAGGTTASTAALAEPLPIGIVAGHWGSDSGSICDGWLREVDVNLAIAQRVVYTLRAMGYTADLLEEFDARLEGYRAQALVSIHADSCQFPEASGFKAARVEDSAVPELEDRLMECIISHYRTHTGLAFHEGSITPDMTRYHTFYEIDSATPGVIIETGFMLADRELLLDRPDLVARGIVEGLLCFLTPELP